MKAFPWQERLNSDDPNVLNPVPHGGMDLRDYFAAHIIQGLLANNLTSDNDANVIKAVWGLADAMMKAREA
jgi:hypothetical protein